MTHIPSFACPSRSTALLLAAFTLASCRGSHPSGERAALEIWVSNEESNDVSVIDGSSNRVVAMIAVGNRPRGIRFSPDCRTASSR